MKPGEFYRYKESNFPLLTSFVGLSQHDVTKEIELPELKSSLVESSKGDKHKEAAIPSDDATLRRSRSRSPDERRHHTMSLTTDDAHQDLERAKGVCFIDIGEHPDETDDHMTKTEKQKLQKLLNDLGDKTSLTSRPRRHPSLAPLPPVVSKGQKSWKPCFVAKRKPKVDGVAFKPDGSKTSKKPVPASDVEKRQRVSPYHVTKREKQKLQRDLRDMTSVAAVPRRHRSLAPVPPAVPKGQRSKSCYEAKRKPRALRGELPFKTDGRKPTKNGFPASDSGAHVTMVEKDKLNKMQQDLSVPVRRRHQSLDSRRSTATTPLQGQRSKSCFTSSQEASSHGVKVSEWKKNTALPPLKKKLAAEPLNLDAPDARIRAKKIKIRHTKKSKSCREKKQGQMAVVAKQGLYQKKHEGTGVSTEYQPPSHLNAYPRIEVRGNSTKTKIPKPKVDILLQCEKSRLPNRHDSKQVSRIPVLTPTATPPPATTTGSKLKRCSKGFQKAHKKVREVSGNRLKSKKSVPLSARAVIYLTKVVDNSGSPNTATPCRSAGRSVSLGSIPGLHLSSSRGSASACILPKPPDRKGLSVSRPTTTSPVSSKSLRSMSVVSVTPRSVKSGPDIGRSTTLEPSPPVSRQCKRSMSASITPRSIKSGCGTDRSTILEPSQPVSRQSKRSMSVASPTPRSVKSGPDIGRSTNLEPSPTVSRQSKRSMYVTSPTPRSVKSGPDIGRSTILEPSPPVSRQSRRSMSVASPTSRSVNSGPDIGRSTNLELSPTVSRQSKRSMSVASITPRSVKSGCGTNRSTNLESSPAVSRQSKRPMSDASVTPRSGKSGHSTNSSMNLEASSPVSRQSKRSMSVASVTPRSATSGHSTDRFSNLGPSPPVSHSSKRSISVASTTPRSAQSGHGTNRSTPLEASPESRSPRQTNRLMSSRSDSGPLARRSDVSLRRNWEATSSAGEARNVRLYTAATEREDTDYAQKEHSLSCIKVPTNPKGRSTNRVDSRISTSRSGTTDSNGSGSSRATTRSSTYSAKYDSRSSGSRRVDSVRSTSGSSVVEGNDHTSSRSSARTYRSTSVVSTNTVDSRSSTPRSSGDTISKSRANSRSVTSASTKSVRSDSRTSRVDSRTSTPRYAHSAASNSYSSTPNYSSNALVNSATYTKPLRAATASSSGRYGSSSSKHAQFDRRSDSINSDVDMDCIKGIYTARSN